MNKLFYLFSVVYLLLLPVLVSGQDLRKLPQQERDKVLLELSKKALLKYGDKEYYKAGLTPQISKEIITGGKYKDREVYVVTYPYDTTKYNMEHNYSASVKIFADTGGIGFIMFGNGWGVAVDWLLQNSSKIERVVFDESMRKKWDAEICKVWDSVRMEEAHYRRLYEERWRRKQDSLRQSGDTLRRCKKKKVTITKE